MRRFDWKVLFVLVLALSVAGAADAAQHKKKRRLRSIRADVTEKKISRKALPAEVLKSFEEHYPTATIKAQTKETSEGNVYYEIESVDSSKNRNVLFKPDGSIVEVEVSIPVGSIPRFVRDGVKDKYPDARIVSAESVTRDSHAEYELVLGIGSRTIEVVVSPSGKVFKIN
ncbi:MAG TPA: PepSY-like domain-containing protein [Bacteroidota bacterium]|jgi:hypothetical protein|nr:PepSY-like domain-containing protein [Bacteroidota bacterium]